MNGTASPRVAFAALLALSSCSYHFDNPVATQLNGSIGGRIRLVDAGTQRGPSLADVSVNLLWTGLSLSVDPATGRFLFLGLPNGSYTLRYQVAPTVDGGLPFIGLLQNIVLPQQQADQNGAGQTADALDLGTIELQLATRVSGCVADDAGMPVSGGVVIAALEPDSGVYESFTAAVDGGRFTVDLPAGSHQLWMSSSTAFGSRTLDGGPGQTQSFDDCVGLTDPPPDAGLMTMNLVLGVPGYGASASAATVEAVVLPNATNVGVALSGNAEAHEHSAGSQIPGVGLPFTQPIWPGTHFDFACFLMDAGVPVNLGVLVLNHLPALFNHDLTLGQVTWLPDTTYAANGVAAPKLFDAGTGGGPVDAGIDAGLDAGQDAGPDGGPDAGPDAGSDAGLDAGPDAGFDAGLDGGSYWYRASDSVFDGGAIAPVNNQLVGMYAVSANNFYGKRLAWLYDGTVWTTDDLSGLFGPPIEVYAGSPAASGLVGGPDALGRSVLVMSVTAPATAPSPLLCYAIHDVDAGWGVQCSQNPPPIPGDRTLAFATGTDAGLMYYVAGVDSSGGLFVYEDHGTGPNAYVPEPIATNATQVAITGCGANVFKTGVGLCMVYGDNDGGLTGLAYDPALNANGATLGVVGSPIPLSQGASEPSIVAMPVFAKPDVIGVSWVSSGFLNYGELSDFGCGTKCLKTTATTTATQGGATLLNLKGHGIAPYVDPKGNAGSLYFGPTIPPTLPPPIPYGYTPPVTGTLSPFVAGFSDAFSNPWAGFVIGTATQPDYTLYRFMFPSTG